MSHLQLKSKENLYQTDDLRINALKELIQPWDLMRRFPASSEIAEMVHYSRRSTQSILHGDDRRLLCIVGPCSIHDPDAAVEYAHRLAEYAKRYSSELHIVMRVYFEKPRTTVGWKGLINDPMIDNSFRINDGLEIARKLLLDIHSAGMTAATEYLDTITPQFIGDLISWAAIGARTTESQVHRELASGLSCPMGFKNGTDGNTQIAIDAIRASMEPHHFLSVTKLGHAAIVSTTGNPDCHVILRGGKTPNYERSFVDSASHALSDKKLPPKVMIDCSHGNSSKDYRRQIAVAEDIANQLRNGSNSILGVMVESNLVEGRQDYDATKQMIRGQSITDSCINLEETERLLDLLANANRRD